MNASELALRPTGLMEGVNHAIPRVRIVSRRNGVGLDRDVELLRNALPIGIEIESHTNRSLKSFQDILSWNSVDSGLLNILVERVPLTWSYAQGQTVLIPNQERFPRRDLPRLNRVDTVLCKSRHAEQIFRKYARDARYVGFTSLDRKLRDVQPDYRRFLHLAGRSTLKGTAAVLELWRRHPEWPSLTLIQHSADALTKSIPKNVELIDQYVSDAKLKKIQNEHGINICPSLSEGWGHYIVEGMSCRSVVLTTDAPPMNELVDGSRGILVPWTKATPRHLGTNFSVDLVAMEAAIDRVFHTSDSTLHEMGMAARSWFESNQRVFQHRMMEVFDDLLYSRTC